MENNIVVSDLYIIMPIMAINIKKSVDLNFTKPPIIKYNIKKIGS